MLKKLNSLKNIMNLRLIIKNSLYFQVVIGDGFIFTVRKTETGLLFERDHEYKNLHKIYENFGAFVNAVWARYMKEGYFRECDIIEK